MKITLTSTAPDMDADIDPRFGRSAYLILLETDTGEWEAHSNPGREASGGAGIQAAQFVIDHKGQAALSGDFGPNAFEALQAANIPMYTYSECQTIREAVERFKASQLVRAEMATRGENASRHHGGL